MQISQLLMFYHQYKFKNNLQKTLIKKIYMNRLIKAIHKGFNSSHKYSFGSITKSGSNITDITQRQHNKFIPHVYGIQLGTHMLPNAIAYKRVQLSQEEYNFYQKVAPNYIVGLVKKVISDSTNVSQPDKPTNPLDQFYKVCTYCNVKYLDDNSIQLQGLYKVKIDDIKKIELEKFDPTLQANQLAKTGKKQEQSMDDMDKDQQFQVDEIKIQKNQQSKLISSPIRKLIKKSFHNKLHSKRQSCYQLKVKKIDDVPYIITQQLELKFNFLINNYLKMFKIQQKQQYFSFNIKDLLTILDGLAFQCSLGNSKKQDIQKFLQADDPQVKIDILLQLLNRNKHMSNYFLEIQNQAKNSIRNKKFYQYYSEMMKIAKQVVDGKKTKQLFLQKSVKSFQSMNPPKQIAELFQKQVQKYEQLDQNSMQAGTVKSYIEQLSKIPYNVRSQEIFDLQFAQKVMDQQHYGMKQVKDAIMQVIAVGKLKKTLKGKIFCFIGGPGLGKTSFAKSVARALNRKFYNISLGGVSDSSVLKGHRRTYMGAYSGKIIQALKNCGTNNPVILLDEIDKMGSSNQGDPRSQLLQILDPNQNNSFVDNYVDVPVDLSNVLFITSANYEKNISKPLLDRMERIYLTSYTKAEKIQIFNQHLLRRAIDKSGVQRQQFSLPPQVIDTLIQQYSLGEPGVRYLEKYALNLLEKVAYKMLTKQEQVPVKITKQNLYQYLGNPHFRRRDHSKIGKGVAISLGGGDYGSRLTYIQAFKKSYISRKQINRGTLFTGSLGDVFKQAMNISYTYARNFLLENFKNRYLYQNQVHVHAPEGAFKKDGSTDSLTIVAALVSLALQTKVKTGIAMTGQLTLNGQILRTHSIKQKIMVAKKQRIYEVILPKDNKPDVQNCPKDITQGITFYYVSNFSQAFDHLFPDKAKSKIPQTVQVQA